MRVASVVSASVGRSDDAADDGAYDLLDVSGAPAEVGRLIGESLGAVDLWSAAGGSVVERGGAVYVSVLVRVELAREGGV